MVGGTGVRLAVGGETSVYVLPSAQEAMMADEVPFHATRMGARFYERTMPELVRQIARLAEAVEKLVGQHSPAAEPDAEAE